MSNEAPPDPFKEALAGVVLHDTSDVLTLDSANAELPSAPSGEGKFGMETVESTQLGNILQGHAVTEKVSDDVFDQALATIVAQEEPPSPPSPEHDPGKDI